MNSTFYGSPDVKKMNLNKWVESQSDYKKKKKLAMLFRTVAFVVLLICILLPVLLLMGNDAIYKGLLAGIIIGLIFALIPFFIGGAIKRKVNYDREFHIVTIIGEAELLAYDDYAGNRLNHQKSQRKFYNNSPYQILMSFDEEQEIVQLVSKMAKNRTEV